MWVLLALLSLAVATVKGVPLARHARLIGRETASNSSYDFVILGGGTSGLTVADRLTENPKSKSVMIDNFRLRRRGAYSDAWPRKSIGLGN